VTRHRAEAPDVIVVGSGPCGATAAGELTRRGLSVLMLDAGRRRVPGAIVRAGGNTLFGWADPRRLSTNRHVATGDPSTTWTSSLTLGGLSNYWTSAVPRMAPEDFTEGARLDERYRWPITYEDLGPYYDIVERTMAVTAGAPLLGVPPNVTQFCTSPPGQWADVVERLSKTGTSIGPMPMAKGRPWMAALKGTGFNSYTDLIRPLEGRSSFRLVRGAQVTRIEPTSSGLEVAVAYIDTATGEQRSVRARAVAVAAGTLDSTKLLLQSTSSDFPDGLGNSRGVLGRYLHDHPKQWWPARLGQRMPVLRHPLYIAREAGERSDPLMASSLTIGRAGVGAKMMAFLGGTSDLVGVQAFGTMIPTEDFTVRVAPDGERLEINIAYDEAALRNMEQARERFARLLGEAGVRATPLGPFEQITPGASYHWGGTVRMHDDPRFGVLDRWNRVYDCPRVIVCDASCFPTGAEKNPTLTAMAIACRAAHRLAQELGFAIGS
jgi:choline dehydrogenase-like flavoprotein